MRELTPSQQAALELLVGVDCQEEGAHDGLLVWTSGGPKCLLHLNALIQAVAP